MSIQFTDIAGPFAQKGLQLPDLNVLKPNSEWYEILAIQPVGEIAPLDNFVGHMNRDLAINKFSTFIALASEKNADLVLSPEYSFPWEALQAKLQEGEFPAVGKLWVLGCESISRDRFGEIKAALQNIEWIHEPLPNTAGDFLGVVCYLFRTKTTEGQEKNVVLAQFKTVAMAGHDTSEAEHLILGQTVYFLRNQDDYIRFTTLICSETLQFELSQGLEQQFDQHPWIIFHPQLTGDPNNAASRKYRNDLYSHGCGRDLEVISLNWARGTKIGNYPITHYGNSTIFLKSEKFDYSDNRLHQNHVRGLYYCHWFVNRTRLCLLNYDEHIFHFRTKKPRLLGLAVELNRTGPEMLTILGWQGESWQVSAIADDGFQQLCISLGQFSFDGCRYS
jgi:hypothetical protein